MSSSLSLVGVRYSVVFLVIVAGLCLWLLLSPAPLAAQDPTEVPEDASEEVASTEDAEDGEFFDGTDLEPTDTDGSSEEVAEQNTRPHGVPEDSYRRERLPTGAVFSDFVVGPGRISLELEPGQSRTVELVVSNRMGDGRVFSFEMEDMTGSETGEQAVILLGDQIGPYTLRDFISVPYERFYLEHGYRARIPVTVSLPADAEPGGRYGSLLTSIVSNPVEMGQQAGAQSGSAIISRTGTLFFITTPGEIDRESELIGFDTKNGQRFFLQGPIAFNLVTENTGTVHTSPYGRITVRNILGEQIWVRNIDPWFVMPRSLRTREIAWEPEFLFGRYTATAEINRSYDDIIDIKTISFWVIPWKLVGAVFVGLFFFFLLLRFFFSRFELKRKG